MAAAAAPAPQAGEDEPLLFRLIPENSYDAIRLCHDAFDCNYHHFNKQTTEFLLSMLFDFSDEDGLTDFLQKCVHCRLPFTAEKSRCHVLMFDYEMQFIGGLEARSIVGDEDIDDFLRHAAAIHIKEKRNVRDEEIKEWFMNIALDEDEEKRQEKKREFMEIESRSEELKKRLFVANHILYTTNTDPLFYAPPIEMPEFRKLVRGLLQQQPHCCRRHSSMLAEAKLSMIQMGTLQERLEESAATIEQKLRDHETTCQQAGRPAAEVPEELMHSIRLCQDDELLLWSLNDKLTALFFVCQYTKLALNTYLFARNIPELDLPTLTYKRLPENRQVQYIHHFISAYEFHLPRTRTQDSTEHIKYLVVLAVETGIWRTSCLLEDFVGSKKDDESKIAKAVKDYCVMVRPRRHKKPETRGETSDLRQHFVLPASVFGLAYVEHSIDKMKKFSIVNDMLVHYYLAHIIIIIQELVGDLTTTLPDFKHILQGTVHAACDVFNRSWPNPQFDGKTPEELYRATLSG